jgi:hypothetical protein
MIKHLKWYHYLPFILVIILVSWYLFQKKTISTPQTPLKKVVHILNGRRVLNIPSNTKTEDLKKIKITNAISPEWQKKVEKSLRFQGGDSIKKLEINKIESLIWAQNKQALNVESLQIKITDQKGVDVSFRALVDSSNGKMIQTWDQPVIDPVNPREEFRIKVDPRYLND